MDKAKKMNGHDMKNYYNAVRNFMDVVKDFEAGVSSQAYRENPEKYNGLMNATSRLWHLQASYGMFKDRQKDTDFHSIIEEIYSKCEKSGLTSGNLEKLNRNIVLSFLGAMVFALLGVGCLSAIKILDTRGVFGKHMEDVVTCRFDVENVNLVQYSDRDYLTSFVYLKAPNGKRIKIEDFDLYNEVKWHIGQTVELRVRRKYTLKKNGNISDVHEDFVKPFVVIGFSGEAVEMKDKIHNVEVQKRMLVIPIIK